MFNLNSSLIAAALTFVAATTCWGHGQQPLIVGVANGKLTVMGGFDGYGGFASQVFADPDEEALLVSLPGNPGLVYTTLPGFTLQPAIGVGSGLSLKAVPRRQLGDASGQEHWLWHWRQSTGAVEAAPNDPTLTVITAFDGGIELHQYGAPSSNEVQFAEPTAEDLSSHGDFLRPLLDNSPTAPAGVYAFFARITSPSYEASDAILIALNLGLDDPAEFEEGALAINRAAGLAGDYDFDGDVDGADLLIWQRRLGVPPNGTGNGMPLDGEDLTIWSTQFGMSTPGASIALATIPEPTCGVLAAIAMFGAIRRVRR